MVDVRTEVSDVKDDVKLLLDEQPLQDERILALEQDTDQLQTNLFLVQEDVQGLL